METPTLLLLTTLTILLLPLLLSPKATQTLKHKLNLLRHHHPKPTTIHSLYIYPIKSCRGIRLPHTTLHKHGLSLDRRWMFIDAKTNQFLTIRQDSRMTLITTALSPDSSHLIISIPSFSKDQEISLPTEPTADWLAQHTTLEHVTIWDTVTDAYAYGSEVNARFSEFLGREVKLVYKGPERRILRGNGAPEILGREQDTYFPDVHPVLIASAASIEELNGRLVNGGNEAITIERFRPNIVVTGDVPWEEDSWKVVRIVGGDNNNKQKVELDVVARCARCQVPNVDPDTAVKNARQPWDTLMKYRRVDEGIKFKPCFGMLSAPRQEGRVEVGMKFEVVGVTDGHRYIKGF
ncbi:hypothetical protein AbraIFM66950_008698 [Aspergillus brasiliensis]|nr:hypothetical protein AbraIFM66950_008698 [Aspergillus brasiliensis]